MDNVALWLIVVGIFTGALGIGLVYVSYTTTTIQRQLLSLLESEKKSKPVVEVVGTPALAEGEDKGMTRNGRLQSKDGGGLESLFYQAPAFADGHVTAPQTTSSDLLSRDSAFADLIARIKHLEADVSELQTEMATVTQQHQRLAERLPGGASASDGVGDVLTALGNTSGASKMMTELVQEMTTQQSSRGSNRLAALRPAAVHVPRSPYAGSPSPSHMSVGGGALSPIPQNLSEDFSIAAIPALPVGSSADALFPEAIEVYEVLDAPPNTSGLPSHDVPALAKCSSFSLRRACITADAHGRLTLELSAANRSAASTSTSSLASRIAQRQEAASSSRHIKMGEVVVIHIGLDILPATKEACVVLVFVRATSADKGRQPRTPYAAAGGGLPPPKRRGSFGSDVQTSEDSTRIVICAVKNGLHVDAFVNFVSHNFSQQVRFTSRDAALL